MLGRRSAAAPPSVVHTQDVRVLAALLLLLLACEPAAEPEPSSPAPSPSTTPAASPTAVARSRYGTLLYGELLADDGPLAVRAISLATGVVREIASVAPKKDARLALSPDERQLAIVEREDLHEQRTSRWRLRLVDLADGRERELTAPRVDTYEEVPWDVGWSAGGALLVVSPRRLIRVALSDGTRGTVRVFSGDTVGATLRDPAHPGLLVSQTIDTISVHLLETDGSGARLRHERRLVGVAAYARRPGSDEILELVTRFDGQVTLALLRPDGGEDARILQGPRVDGLVELIGTTASAAYLLWPIAREDSAALQQRGTALFYRLDFDGAARIVDATRNWGPAGPLGLAPDGSALLIPTARRAGSSRFALAVCCATRPARPLLPPAERVVIGWLSEP